MYQKGEVLMDKIEDTGSNEGWDITGGITGSIIIFVAPQGGSRVV